MLIRRYGYGVPDLARAIRSLSNDVAMVIEGTVQPYDGSDGAMAALTIIQLYKRLHSSETQQWLPDRSSAV